MTTATNNPGAFASPDRPDRKRLKRLLGDANVRNFPNADELDACRALYILLTQNDTPKSRIRNKRSPHEQSADQQPALVINKQRFTGEESGDTSRSGEDAQDQAQSQSLDEDRLKGSGGIQEKPKRAAGRRKVPAAGEDPGGLTLKT